MEFLSFSDLLDQYKYKGKAIEIQTEISNANSKTVSPKVRYVSPCFPRKRDKYTTVIPRKKKIDNETKTTAITKKRNCRKTKKRRCLSKHELFMEAYRRKTVDNTWKPPKSPYGLLQEKHAHDPWRVLVICKLLNVTSGPQVKNVVSSFFSLCPNAKSCTDVAAEEIEKVIRSLGCQNKRSIQLKRLSKEYLDQSWTHVTQLHGVGKYAADAYAIFCTGKWEQVIPEDNFLTKYWSWLEGSEKEDCKVEGLRLMSEKAMLYNISI